MLQCTITFAVVTAAKREVSRIMCTEPGSDGETAESRARGNHGSNPGRNAVDTRNLRGALCALGLANATPAQIARSAFDGKASERAVKSWLHGERYVAPWAIELLSVKAAQLARHANEMPRGPGMTAGLRPNGLALARDERRA